MNKHAAASIMVNWPESHGGSVSPIGGGEMDWGDFSRQAEQPSLLFLSDAGSESAQEADVVLLAKSLGFRLFDQVPIGDAGERLSHLVDVDAVLVRCTGGEAGLDLLLARLDTMAGVQGTGLVVIVDFDGLDHVHAIVGASSAMILCHPSPGDVIVALSLVSGRLRHRERLHDIGREGVDPRIDKLSDELVRLSRTIEALVQNRAPSHFPLPGGAGEDFTFRSPERSFASYPAGDKAPAGRTIAASQVRAVLRSRRLRDHIFSPDLFADPAWDILLDLMAARLEGARVSVSSLCIAAAVPPTTALRWIRQLTDRGLLERQADPDDGRRIFITLSDKGVEGVMRWFEESRGHMMFSLNQGNDGKGASKASA